MKMKNIKIFAVAIALVAGINTVNAQNEADLSDFNYMSQKLASRTYTDHYLYSVGEDPHEYSCCTLQKHGAYIGAAGGVRNFDGHTDPTLGVVVGWEGKTLGFEYTGDFSKGSYTEEADRSNSYLEFDSRLSPKVKVFDTNNHDWQLWLGIYGSYKLNFNYNKNENTSTKVVETETEIVKTTESVFQDIEVKGSSMGFGAQAWIKYRPYMSKFNFALTVYGGRQQRYYLDGNRWKNEFGAELQVTFNFNAQKLWDEAFLQKTGLSKKDVKRMNKARRTVSLY